MRRMGIVAAGLVILMTVGALLILDGEKPVATETGPILSVRSAVGFKDDPRARLTYETMRLRNPATGRIPPGIHEREQAFAQTLPTVEALGKSSGTGVLNWSFRGPINVGGRTRAIGIDIDDENIWLAGGVSGGMYRSTNQGASWTAITTAAGLHNVTCLVQDTRPGHTDTWYYGTGEAIGNSAAGSGAFFYGDGIYRSSNNGASWTVLPSTSTNVPHAFDNIFDIVWNLAIDPSNTSQDEVYAATYGAVFRSVDGGNSWAPVRGGNQPYSYFVDVAVTSTGIVYAAMSSDGGQPGIWRSTNGLNWTDITPQGWPTEYERIVIGIAPSDEDIVYFLCNSIGEGFQYDWGTPGDASDDEWHVFWKYDDGTGQWADRSANLPDYGGDVGTFYSQDSYDLVVQVHPSDPDVVFVGGVNLCRSMDGFATPLDPTTDPNSFGWIGGYATANNITMYANQHADQHAIAFLPSNPDVLYSGHDAGVSKTLNNRANGVTWISLNNGYRTTQYYTVAIDPFTAGEDAIIGGMQDNGTYMNPNANANVSWTDVLSGDGCFCAITPVHGLDRSTYQAAQNGIIYRMTWDAAWNYLDFTRVDPVWPGAAGEDFDYLFVAPFALDPNNDKRMYLAAGDHIMRNDDLTGIPFGSNSRTAVNWTQLLTTSTAGVPISAVGVSTTPADRVYYGTAEGRIYRLNGADGAAPAPQDIGTGKGLPADAYVSCLMVDPLDADKVLAVFSNYEVQSLFYTTDGGGTWTHVGGNLEQNADGSGNGPSCRWAAVAHSATGPIHFVATSTGLYSTKNIDSGNPLWGREGTTTIGNVVTNMVVARQSDGWVVVGTHGAGVFATTVDTDVAETPGAPVQFTLSQNYPNPFNPTTTIAFTLPVSRHVRLRIFDIRGREVARLLDEHRSAGSHEIEFDAQHLESGMYTYTLEAGDHKRTKKLTVLK